MNKTIAFIPVRGGSKSIPLKNIKLLCGKPLVCWCIEALEKCDSVDIIVVATDSKEIEKTVLSFGYTKTEIYHRSAENASDTASTESVMLEYIAKGAIDSDDIFMLVQATSPLTQTNHFQEALELYANGDYDSILSCVRNKRFFWGEDGTSINYDYKNRPRRQDFRGVMMENGAFYINKVSNIVRNNNRLSGSIGVYEMPEYTATEIDEPDDWIVLEHLMMRYKPLQNTDSDYSSIKLFITDVDGTLTDGGMYYSEKGDELKKFNTRDGMGLQLLREFGIKTAIVTSENTKLVIKRAQKLKIDFIYQGAQKNGKLDAVKEICSKMGIGLENVAYIGDDINCMDILKSVGVRACPNDASSMIKAIKGMHIMHLKGGEGCVREFAEMILLHQR